VLRERIFGLSSTIQEKPQKMYIIYQLAKYFCQVRLQRNEVKIWVDMPIEKIRDPDQICRDVRNIGRYATGVTEMYLRSQDELDKVFDIIKQSFEYNL
jgi:predicted transport protein